MICFELKGKANLGFSLISVYVMDVEEDLPNSLELSDIAREQRHREHTSHSSKG